MSDQNQPSDLSEDDKDLLRLTKRFDEQYLKRCVGGRFMRQGLVCAHCESQQPDAECFIPKENK